MEESPFIAHYIYRKQNIKTDPLCENGISVEIGLHTIFMPTIFGNISGINKFLHIKRQ